MPTVNIGNVVGLLKGTTAPAKKYVIWAKILNPSFPDIVELHYWDDIAGTWTPLTETTTNYWLRPVISATTTTPPVTPTEGDRYIIPTGATGVWSGKAAKVATYKSSVWQYIDPLDGFMVIVRDEASTIYDFRGVFGSGGAWFVNDFSLPVAPGTYVPVTEKGVALGIPTLNSSAHIPKVQLDGSLIPFDPAVPVSWPGGMDNTNDALDYLRTIAGGTSDTDDWKRGGNTVGAVSSMGTIDNYDVSFKSNSSEVFRITTGGNIGVGLTSGIDSKVHIRNTVNGKAYKIEDSASNVLMEIGQSGGVSYINIGRTGVIINMAGDVNYNNVTQLQVTDPLITINKGGGIASAVDSGFEIEENSIITGYIKTTSGRDGYRLKAPNNANIASISLSALTANRTYTLPDSTGTLADQTYVLGNNTYVGSKTFRVGVNTAGGALAYFQSGTNLTVIADGAWEYNGTHLYFSIGSTRYQIDQQSGGGGHVIKNSGTSLTARANLNFTNGLTASDNTPNTDVKLGGAISSLDWTLDDGGYLSLTTDSLLSGLYLLSDNTGVNDGIGLFGNNASGTIQFDFGGTTSGVFTDVRSSKKGIEYAATGYVTQTHSLTDREYVLGAKTYVGAQTIPSSNLIIQNPALTFGYTIIGSAIVANRNLTIPLLTGNDTFEVLGLAQTITGVKTFASSALLLQNPAATFAYTFVGSAIVAARNLTVPLLTSNDTLAVLGLAQTYGAKRTFVASASGSASINIIPGTAPSSPNNGDIWVTSNTGFLRAGGVTKTFGIIDGNGTTINATGGVDLGGIIGSDIDFIGFGGLGFTITMNGDGLGGGGITLTTQGNSNGIRLITDSAQDIILTDIDSGQYVSIGTVAQGLRYGGNYLAALTMYSLMPKHGVVNSYDNTDITDSWRISFDDGAVQSARIYSVFGTGIVIDTFDLPGFTGNSGSFTFASGSLVGSSTSSAFSVLFVGDDGAGNYSGFGSQGGGVFLGTGNLSGIIVRNVQLAVGNATVEYNFEFDHLGSLMKTVGGASLIKFSGDSTTSNLIELQHTYNANGKTNTLARGIYYNPSFTSAPATHYAWESTSGAMKWAIGKQNLNMITGAWTAGANNDYHMTFEGLYTARSTASDIISGYVFKPTLIAAANTQNLRAVVIDPTFTNGAFTGLTNTALRVVSGIVDLGGALKLRAGAAAVDGGPLYFQSGTNLTTIVNGAMEFNGTNLFFSRAGGVRENVIIAVDNAAAPSTTATPTFTSYYGGNTKALGDPNRWISVNVLGTVYKIPMYT